MPMLCRRVSRKLLCAGWNLKSLVGSSRYPINGCGSSDNGLRSKVRTANREGSRCGEREPSFFCASGYNGIHSVPRALAAQHNERNDFGSMGGPAQTLRIISAVLSGRRGPPNVLGMSFPPAENPPHLPHRLLQPILVFHERHAAIPLACRAKTAARADCHVCLLQ